MTGETSGDREWTKIVVRPAAGRFRSKTLAHTAQLGWPVPCSEGWMVGLGVVSDSINSYDVCKTIFPLASRISARPDLTGRPGAERQTVTGRSKLLGPAGRVGAEP